ncbi:MAG: hypothetical protein AAFX02_00750 [Pseudomonadota bacterium]
MLAAASLMIIFIISFTIVRISSVAMRLTGMTDGQARFQALSALTGTGFTTTEAEMIVNYPIRRKIVANLMVVGNLGLVSVVSTMMISFLRTEAELDQVLIQIAWIAGGVGVLYLIITNPYVDRLICWTISSFLNKFTRIGKRSYHRLLQLGDGVSIVEHHLALNEHTTAQVLLANFPSLSVLAVRGEDGKTLTDVPKDHDYSRGDAIILVGNDVEHEALAAEMAEMEAEMDEATEGETDEH